MTITSIESTRLIPSNWLPRGKQAAVCFTIDDIHPGKSSDPYEAGGDLQAGALGLVEEILRRQTQLQITLFTTPDWREIRPYPTHHLLANLPYLQHKAYLSSIHPKGTMALCNHPDFVLYLKQIERIEIGVHGLHHVHPGHWIPIEFQQQNESQCVAMLQQALALFCDADLQHDWGFAPPAWNAPLPLINALIKSGFRYITSARDLVTPIAATAQTAMSGLRGYSLIFPQWVKPQSLLHISTNFQATSTPERAFAILENHGLLAIKGHIIKSAFGHIALDGIDQLYVNYLDLLFSEITRRYGDTIWWTTMGQIAKRLTQQIPN